MVTADRELVEQKKRLRNIQVETLSDNFENLSTNDLKALYNEAKGLSLKLTTEHHQKEFKDIEHRIIHRLDSVMQKSEFSKSTRFSISILIIAVLTLVVSIIALFI